MNRLREADRCLKELLKSDLEGMQTKERIEAVADDVMRLLSLLRTPSSPPLTPALSPKSTLSSGSKSFMQSAISLQNLYLLSPTSSAQYLDDNDEIERIHISAHYAFNAEIYARCVKIVEEAAKRNLLDIELTFLAHCSYERMVENAENLKDAKKFASFWLEFLELNRDYFKENFDEHVQYFECLVFALEKRYEIDESCREDTGKQLLATLTNLNQNSNIKPLLMDISYWNQLRKWTEELKPLLEDTKEWNNANAELACSPEMEILYVLEENKRQQKEPPKLAKFPSISSDYIEEIIHL
ncbi:unnamed protein product, partial [Mesorhabditis belari]|uniref:Uncharacterized protein n=1 Tax=Mesorhabditis belari TaxID=2138241 RepID=A0AAF3EAM5_9BILA